MLKMTDVIDKFTKIKGEVPAAIEGARLLVAFIAGSGPDDKQSVIGMLSAGLQGQGGYSLWKMKELGDALIPFSTAMSTLADVVTKVNQVGDNIPKALQSMLDMIQFMKKAQDLLAAGGIGNKEGGVFGIGSSSSFDRFGEAMKPFSEAMTKFGDVVRVIAGMSSNMVTAEDVMVKLNTILVKAALSVSGSANESSLTSFKNSLARLGEGVEYFSDRVKNTNSNMMSTIASSLERIAAIKFANSFDPLLQLLSRTADMEKAAMGLEKMQKALQPPPMDFMAQLGGAISQVGNALNGGSVANTANSPINSNGRNPLVDTAILTMRNLMEKWDHAASATQATQKPNSSQGSAAESQPKVIPVFALANAQNQPFPAAGQWNGVFGGSR